ncbi:hypothetical protein NE664_01030 [Anaerotignum faecicola]|nr:hypothetical protein [Anaerotignum faecicola]
MWSQRVENIISGLRARKKYEGVAKATSKAFDAAIVQLMISSTVYALVN